jgi:hypothetical protein
MHAGAGKKKVKKVMIPMNWNLIKKVIKKSQRMKFGRLIILGLVQMPAILLAQGTLDTEEVDVIRDYNPILADAVKVSIAGEVLPESDDVLALEYNMPITFYTSPYEPIKIKPVALSKTPQDDLMLNYMKAGFGTQFTPLAEVYLNSNRSDKFQYGLAARYTSSNGARENQQYSDLDIDGKSKIFIKKEYVLPIGLFYRNDVVHYYGYQEDSIAIPDDSVKQRYNRYGFDIGFSNLKENDLDVDFKLNAGFKAIHDISKYRQVNPYLDLWADKELKTNHKTGAGLNIDYYDYNGPRPYYNSFTTLSLRYIIEEEGWSAHASFDNTVASDSKYFALPNVDFSKDLIGDKLVFVAGIDSRLIRNSYYSLSDENPFLADSVTIRPTALYEMYGGIRASTNGNFSFSAKGYYTPFTDQQFFVINNEDSTRFDVVYGQGVMAGAAVEMGYFVADKIHLAAAFNGFTFAELTDVAEAWHTPGLDWRFSGTYFFNSRMSAELDVFGLGKSKALNPQGEVVDLKGTMDINLSANYKYSDHFNIFLDINNIAGIQYERYYNYPSYGFNLLGGLSFSF